jgi:hypothetical protein
MTAREMSAREIDAVLRLEPERRYEHFIKRVADFEQVWSLKHPNGGWVCGAAGAQESMPAWPHRAYADLMADGEWKAAAAAAISLDESLGKWLPGLARDGRLVAVFPSPHSQVVIRAPDALEHDLREYLREWYGEEPEEDA